MDASHDPFDRCFDTVWRFAHHVHHWHLEFISCNPRTLSTVDRDTGAYCDVRKVRMGDRSAIAYSAPVHADGRSHASRCNVTVVFEKDTLRPLLMKLSSGPEATVESRLDKALSKIGTTRYRVNLRDAFERLVEDPDTTTDIDAVRTLVDLHDDVYGYLLGYRLDSCHKRA